LLAPGATLRGLLSTITEQLVDLREHHCRMLS
jgi:hypothetical protein